MPETDKPFLPPYRPDGRKLYLPGDEHEDPEVLGRVDAILGENQTERMGFLIAPHIRAAMDRHVSARPLEYFDLDITQDAHVTWGDFPLRVRVGRVDVGYQLQIYAPHPTEGTLSQSAIFSLEFLRATVDVLTPVFVGFTYEWHSRSPSAAVPFRPYWRGCDLLDPPIFWGEIVGCELELNDPESGTQIVPHRYPPPPRIVVPEVSATCAFVAPVEELQMPDVRLHTLRFLGWLPSRRAYYREEETFTFQFT